VFLVDCFKVLRVGIHRHHRPSSRFTALITTPDLLAVGFRLPRFLVDSCRDAASNQALEAL
jgi:hypothetical protein